VVKAALEEYRFTELWGAGLASAWLQAGSIMWNLVALQRSKIHHLEETGFALWNGGAKSLNLLIQFFCLI
jgi:hypothetical protein